MPVAIAISSDDEGGEDEDEDKGDGTEPSGCPERPLKKRRLRVKCYSIPHVLEESYSTWVTRAHMLDIHVDQLRRLVSQDSYTESQTKGCCDFLEVILRDGESSRLKF